MGVIGACAGCCWVRRCQAWRFQLHPADGPQERQARGEREREGAEDDARATSHANTSLFMPSYQRLAAPSCTSASLSASRSSRSPPSWRSWRPSAGAAENTPFRVFLPTSSRRTLRPAPYLALPMDPLPWTTRSRCCQPPSTSRSSCTALRVQNEQTGGTEVDRQGCRKEKCREALCSRLLLQPRLGSLPSAWDTCP